MAIKKTVPVDFVAETAKTRSVIIKEFPAADGKLTYNPAGMGVKVNLQKSIEQNGLSPELAEQIKAKFPGMVI